VAACSDESVKERLTGGGKFALTVSALTRAAREGETPRAQRSLRASWGALMRPSFPKEVLIFA